MDNIFNRQYGSWALVTGGARGLGLGFAKRLASRGLNLLILDVLEDELKKAVQDLEKDYGVQAEPLLLDLSNQVIFEQLKSISKEKEIGLVVNNAAYGDGVSMFLDGDIDSYLKSIDVNCKAVAAITHIFGNAMKERKRGGIIIISSMTASIGMPSLTNYAATKAYDHIFADSLETELKPENIDVMAVLPGRVDTPGAREALPEQTNEHEMMLPEDVAEEALNALGSKAIFVPGRSNRIQHFIMGLMPRNIRVKALVSNIKRLYPEVKLPD
jgi:short-subunit dehydrogenase